MNTIICKIIIFNNFQSKSLTWLVLWILVLLPNGTAKWKHFMVKFKKKYLLQCNLFLHLFLIFGFFFLSKLLMLSNVSPKYTVHWFFIFVDLQCQRFWKQFIGILSHLPSWSVHQNSGGIWFAFHTILI